MEHMRLILAVLAALLALVFMGVWFAKGRQHSNRRGAFLSYSLLLFASAAVLFIGSQNERDLPSPQTTSNARATPTTESSPKTPNNTTAQESDILHGETSTTAVSAVPVNPKSEEVWQDVKNQPETKTGSQQLSYGDWQKRHPKLKNSAGNLPKASKPTKDKPVEDVIESGVLSAFDAIEIFFETYASPAAVPASHSESVKPSGKIEFVNGTSELNERSKNYLHSLAPQLGRMYEYGQLEIRAQSDENVDSPALRFLLTQSRAEAVRDVLADSGFPADRLVPVGSETAGETRVKFVHRPK